MFCGRILSQSDDGFEKLSVAMATYYSEESADAKELVVGGLYGLKQDQCYHRSGPVRSGVGPALYYMCVCVCQCVLMCVWVCQSAGPV